MLTSMGDNRVSPNTSQLHVPGALIIYHKGFVFLTIVDFMEYVVPVDRTGTLSVLNKYSYPSHPTVDSRYNEHYCSPLNSKIIVMLSYYRLSIEVEQQAMFSSISIFVYLHL